MGHVPPRGKGLQEDESLPGSDERLSLVGQVCYIHPEGTTSFIRGQTGTSAIVSEVVRSLPLESSRGHI